MKIELKGIKFYERLSEETNAFTADLYINGKKAGYVKNDGHGGSTDYYPNEGKRELINEAEQFCLTLPAIKYRSLEIKMNLENKIDQLFEEWLKAKDAAKIQKKLDKDCLKGICFKIDNGYNLTTWKGHTIATLLQHPQGKLAIKAKLAELRREGKEVLNKNIPQELF